VQRFLERPPYYGKSSHQDNAVVRQLCGSTRKFDPRRKMWGTSCEQALRALIASQKWRPDGVERALYAPLMRAAQAHRAKAEAEWHAQREAEALEAAKAESRKRAATWLGDAAARTRTQPRAATPTPTPAAAPATAPATAPRPAAPKRDGIEPNEAEVVECARLGFTPQAIAFSKTLDCLGPRGSLSDEGRLLRYCLLTCDPDGSVRELTRKERACSWGGREVRWTLPETTSREYSNELNRLAADAAASR